MGPTRTEPLKDRGKTPNASKKAEYEDKIRKTKNDEAEFLKSSEQKRKNFERVQGEYKDGLNSKFKAEFEKAKKEFESDEKKKAEYQKNLKELNDAFDNMEDDWSSSSGVKEEPSEQDGTPLPDNTPPPMPTVEVTGINGERDLGEGTKDKGKEGGALFTLDDLREALGQEERGTVTAWKSGGGSRRVVISHYGPQNARRYRLQKAGQADDAWSEDKLPRFTKTSLRFGAQKDDDNKYIHGGSEVLGIVAVAWYFDDNNQKPQELMTLKTHPKLEPLTKEQQKNQERRPPRPPLYPETQVLVRWNINNKKEESWETRDTVARLYKSAETADQFIYLVAEHQETRYKQWKDKERKSESRSPTPLPGLLRPSATPEPEKVKPKTETPGGATSQEGKEDAARNKWATKKKLDPNNLSDADEARFDVYWEAYQAAAAAAAAAA